MPYTPLQAARPACLALDALDPRHPPGAVEDQARQSAGLAWASVAGVLIAGFSPLGNVLVLPLEQRFSSVAPPSASDRVDGIILLGGFEDGWVSAGRGGLGLNESAERVTEGLRLALAPSERQGGVHGRRRRVPDRDVRSRGAGRRFSGRGRGRARAAGAGKPVPQYVRERRAHARAS